MTPPTNTTDTIRVRAAAARDVQAHRTDALFRQLLHRLHRLHRNP